MGQKPQKSGFGMDGFGMLDPSLPIITWSVPCEFVMDSQPTCLQRPSHFLSD